MVGHVVVDAGPLIHLTQAGALSLLDEFEAVAVPQTVLEEVNSGGVLDGLSEVDHAVEEITHSDEDVPTLDPGETAAIILARDVGAILLTDDLPAREIAADLGIEVHGSIGVVLYGYGRGRLSTTEAEELIRALEHDSTLYLADPLIEYALQVLETDHPDWG